MLVFEPHHGLTHVIDKGLGPRAWEDVLEVAGDYISIVKLGWGTAAVTRNLERKLEVLREKPVVIGGTYFEVVYSKGKLDEYKSWLQGLGLQHVEISDGTVEIPRERKLELIADFARDELELALARDLDGSVGDLDVLQPETLEPRLVLVELPLRVDDLEVRPADDDRLLAEHLELSLQVLRHGCGAPPELDDRDVVAGNLEDVLPRARTESLVDHVGQTVVRLKDEHRAPPASAWPAPGRRGTGSCRGCRFRP